MIGAQPTRNGIWETRCRRRLLPHRGSSVGDLERLRDGAARQPQGCGGQRHQAGGCSRAQSCQRVILGRAQAITTAFSSAGSNLRAAPAPCRRTPEPAPARGIRLRDAARRHARPRHVPATPPPAHADTPSPPRRRAAMSTRPVSCDSESTRRSFTAEPTQALIRVGLGPALESPPPPTPRRPLSEVLEFRHRRLRFSIHQHVTVASIAGRGRAVASGRWSTLGSRRRHHLRQRADHCRHPRDQGAGMSSSRERRTAEPIPRAWAQRPIASGWSGCLWKWMNSASLSDAESQWSIWLAAVAPEHRPSARTWFITGDNAICEPCTLGSPRMGCRRWAASNLMSRPPLF